MELGYPGDACPRCYQVALSHVGGAGHTEVGVFGRHHWFGEDEPPRKFKVGDEAQNQAPPVWAITLGYSLMLGRLGIKRCQPTVHSRVQKADLYPLRGRVRITSRLTRS